MRSGFRTVVVCLARVAATAALVALPAARAAASTVTYDEAVSGDLGLALPIGSPFAFDVGTNTVSGHLFDNANAFDGDSFAFAIPAGAELTGIDLSFTTTAADDSYFVWVRYGLSHGNAFMFPPDLGDSTFDLLAPSPGAVFGGALPLPSGLYGLNWLSSSFGGSGFSMDYTWTFTVEGPAASTVPEPASLALFGTGLFAAATRLRRRR